MRRWWLPAAVLLSVAPPADVLAQAASNYAASYLHPSDVHDARALWVNPAGLAVLREASVYAELVARDPGAQGRLRQLSLGFNARGLSFGYQRDIFDGGVRGHTYRLGLAGGAEGLSAGCAIARYGGGGGKGTGWDFGLTYAWRPTVSVAGVLANVGQPVVRGIQQRLAFVPGITWRPRGPTLAVSIDSRITPDSVLGYAVGVSWQSSSRLPLGILARLDADGDLRRTAFAFGVSIGGADRVGTVLQTPGDVSHLDAAGLYGLSTREPTVGRR